MQLQDVTPVVTKIYSQVFVITRDTAGAFQDHLSCAESLTELWKYRCAMSLGIACSELMASTTRVFTSTKRLKSTHREPVTVLLNLP